MLYRECPNDDCAAGYLSDMSICGCVRIQAVPVEPDQLQITTVDIGGTVGAIKLHSEDAGRTWTSIRPDDWPESDPE